MVDVTSNYGLQIERLELALSAARRELADWKTWGIVEIAIRNVNVKSYVEHWEGRALKAERELQQARREALDTVIVALDRRLESLMIMTDRAGYTREGSDLAQRTSATRDALDIVRSLKDKPSPARGEQINADDTGGRVSDLAGGSTPSPIPASSAPNAAGKDNGISGKSDGHASLEPSASHPSPAAPSTALRSTGDMDSGSSDTRVQAEARNADLPAAAVPDDPVAVYEAVRWGIDFELDPDRHEKALRALAAHYMRKAAEICRTAAKGESYEAEIDMANGCADAVLSAAAELERKP